MEITEIPLSRVLAAVPLQQSPGYGRALRRLGAGVRRVELAEAGQVWGQALILRRGWGRFGLSLAMRGPVWQGDPAPDRRERLLAGLARETGPLVVQGAAGIRLAAGRSLAILPLSAPEAQRRGLASNWRNHLRRGEASGLTVDAICPGPEDVEPILAADRRQQRARAYRALPDRFLQAWAACSPHDMRLYRARSGSEVVAAALFLLHRPWATYHIALSSEAARRGEAHRLILWRAMLDLRVAGYSTLDLGLAEAANPGLLAFKRGTGARIETIGPSVLLLPVPARRCGSPAASGQGWARADGT